MYKKKRFSSCPFIKVDMLHWHAWVSWGSTELHRTYVLHLCSYYLHTNIYTYSRSWLLPLDFGGNKHHYKPIDTKLITWHRIVFKTVLSECHMAESSLLYRGQEFDSCDDLNSVINNNIKMNHPLRIFNSQTAGNANRKHEEAGSRLPPTDSRQWKYICIHKLQVQKLFYASINATDLSQQKWVLAWILWKQFSICIKDDCQSFMLKYQNNSLGLCKKFWHQKFKL